MNLPKIVSHDELLVARRRLLVNEKDFTRARDRLNAERRRLPMVRIDNEYGFDGQDGNATLFDLFDGRRQLVVYHFMFDPAWTSAARAARWSSTSSATSRRTYTPATPHSSWCPARATVIERTDWGNHRPRDPRTHR
jgi:predicted dithiol-disulfide oxidoreductase (DUF899 family)